MDEMEDFFRKGDAEEKEPLISLVGFKDKNISVDETIGFSPFLSKAKIAFIDSGFQEITEGVFLIKVFSGIWQENKKIRSIYSEFFFRTSDKNSRILSREDNDFSEKIIAQVDPEHMAESIESSAIGFIIRLLDSGDVIVRDGSLDSDLFLDAMEESRKKQILLMGLSKSTSIKTASGDLATDYLLKKNKRNNFKDSCWYFKAFSDDRRDVLFTRLNSLSDYCFRLDVNRLPGLDIRHAVEIIASNAIDPVFMGYPYGLIDCDMNARVSNEECDFHHMKINVEYGINLRKKREDAHNILDNIRF